MSDWLSLTRAARLVGVSRSALQKKIQNGEMISFDGNVTVENLLRCYPGAELEELAELQRVTQIKEKAFGKRVFERALPDAEVLAARITELSKSLVSNQSQLKQLTALLARLWDRLDNLYIGSGERERHEVIEFKNWLKQEVAAAMEPGYENPLAIKDGVLRIMTAQVTVLPGKHDFLVEGQDTLLEAAMRAGIPLNYGCSGGNCGLCKARVVVGEVKKVHLHDFVLTDQEKKEGYILMCSNTAVSDVMIEAAVATGVQDIPYQQLAAKVGSIDLLGKDMALLHLKTPRTQRLRFLAGQSVTLRVGQAYTAELPIASCPCDDRNVLFHLRRQPGNLFSDYIFDHLKRNDVIEIEGPQGEFVLHEKSPRPLYFVAFDGGFASIKSLIEHALSLEVEKIYLHWMGSSPEHIYMSNVARAWADALDNFHYHESVAGVDLRALSGKREEIFISLLKGMVEVDPDMLQADVYLAGPESAVAVAEQFFIGQGMPKTRVSVGSVK